MARSTQPTDPTRKAAFASGVFYLITFAASIPAALMLAPMLTDPAYILGPGADSQIAIACLLDLTNALAAIGSAVAVFSVLRRYHESLALGFVATRLLEAAIIVPGICALLAVTSMRQAGPAAGTDASALLAVGQGLVGFRNWTFILGPSLIPGFNALMFATILYRARLVPRWIPALGLIGAPLLIASVAGIVLGVHQLGSVFSAIATAPIFVWELSVGLVMTFKGFNRNVTMAASGSPDEATTMESGRKRPALATPAGAAAVSLSRFARLRFRPQPRHLLIIIGLAIAIVGNAEAKDHGVGIATVILFSLIPTLPKLLAIGQQHGAGRVAARIVRPYNVTREPLLPVALFGLGVAGVLPPVALAGGLAWLGAIVIAWGLGDGLRDVDGSVRRGLRRVSSMPVLPVPGGRAAAA